MTILQTHQLSSHGIVLRPRYKSATGPQDIPPSEAAYNPFRHRRAHTPKSIGYVAERAVFSAPFPYQVSVDIQLKAAQSDVYFIPDELSRFSGLIQRIADHAHNRTPTAFTRGFFLQVRYNMESPAGYWHYDIGNPSQTYLVADKSPPVYAPGFPLRLPSPLQRRFSEMANLTQFKGRELLLQATDFSRLETAHENGVRLTRPAAYEIVLHDHLTVHKGISAAGRMLVTGGYIDTDQPARYGFANMENRLFPPMQRSHSAPMEEAAERLARYLTRQGPST